MKVVFCGTSEFAAPILKKIKSQTNWDIVLVISEPAKPSGKKRLLVPSPVAQAAQELNLKLATPSSIQDIKSDLVALNPDVMIIVAYGQILPLEIINIPKFKTVNVHPSLLPKLRGASPIQAALVKGLAETGCSLMVIDEKVDHGPVISQEVLAIGDEDTYLTLEPQLAELGAAMVVRDLPQYVSGRIKPQDQNHTEATFTKLIKKENGRIDWQKMSADDVYNLWRAYLKWPGVYTFFKDKSGASIRLKLIQIDPVRSRLAEGTATTASGRSASNGVEKCAKLSFAQKTAGEVFTDESKNLYIACRDGAIKIIKLQPEGSKVLSAGDFLNGYSYVFGQVLSKDKIYNDNNELLLCFDEQDISIVPQPRGIVHEKPYSIWHAITNIWVLNSKGEILCTRRAPHVSGNPGKWQTYVGGHVKAGSDFSETARQELAEEIGLKVNKDNLKLVEKGRREDNMHIYESYAVLFNNGGLSKLDFSDGEISEARWVAFKEYQKSKEENPDKWCNRMTLEQYKKTCEVIGL